MVGVVEGGPQGRALIEGYGGGGFVVGGPRHSGSLLILPDRVQPWPVDSVPEIDAAALQPVFGAATGLEILLIGGGERSFALLPGLRQVLRDHGLGVEAMATAAACRSFNVLVMEGRAAAAALVAVD